MRRFWLLGILFAQLQVGAPLKARETLVFSEGTLNEIAVVSERLNSIPKDHLIVGIGRSPGVFFEYLSIVHPQREVVQIPLSGLRHRLASKNTKPLTNEEQRLIAEHYDVFLKDKIKKYRGIVLVDYASSGTTLNFSSRIMESYLHKKQIDIPVKLVAISNNQKLVFTDLKFEIAHIELGAPQSTLGFMLLNSELDDYSVLGEVNTSDLAEPPETLKERLWNPEKSHVLHFRNLLTAHISRKQIPSDDEAIKPLIFKKHAVMRWFEYCSLLIKRAMPKSIKSSETNAKAQNN
jgi:hypothetical protein